MKMTTIFAAAAALMTTASLATAGGFSYSIEEEGGHEQSAAAGIFAGGAYSHSATSGGVFNGDGFVENRAGQFSSIDMDMDVHADGFTFETTSFTAGLAEQDVWGNGTGTAQFSGESLGGGIGGGMGVAHEWETDYEVEQNWSAW